MKTTLKGLLAVLLLGILMEAASAQLGGNLTINASDPVYINVSISTRTMIDVQPYALSWVGIEPGGVGDNLTEALGPNYFAIQVENIGSHNITHVWFNASHETRSPFGRTTNSYTNAGNYVALSRNVSVNRASNASFWFINRVEFNETTELVYIRDPNGNIPPNEAAFTYGRFRNATREYFWMINAGGGNCAAATYIRIGNTSHMRTQTGTTNFQTGDYLQVGLTGWGTWRVGRVSLATHPLHDYEIAINSSCAVFFSHWNRDDPFDRVGTEAEYAYDGNLTPGDSFAMAIKVYVPYGTYEGQAGEGTIWAIVNDV